MKEYGNDLRGMKKEVEYRDPNKHGKNLQVVWPGGFAPSVRDIWNKGHVFRKGMLSVWTDNMAAYGYPGVADDTTFREVLRVAYDNGVSVIPYVGLTMQPENAPNWGGPGGVESEFIGDSDTRGGLWAYERFPGGLGKTRELPYDPGYEKGRVFGACPNARGWHDEIIKNLDVFLSAYTSIDGHPGVAGIYVDNWAPTTCFNEDHGVNAQGERQYCGWTSTNLDGSTIVGGRAPIRAHRELLRAARRSFVGHGIEAPVIICQMQEGAVSPMLSFADGKIDGEQYKSMWRYYGLGMKPDKLRGWVHARIISFEMSVGEYLPVVPLARWRVENDGYKWGVQPFFLPEFQKNKYNDPSYDDDGNMPAALWDSGVAPQGEAVARHLTGITLLHGASPWPWSSPCLDWGTIWNAWDALDKSALRQTDAEFIPYWKQTNVSSGTRDLVISLYRSPTRSLLIVMNINMDVALRDVDVVSHDVDVTIVGKEVSSTLTLDFDFLAHASFLGVNPLYASAGARDLRDVASPSGRNVLSVTLEPLGYCLLEVWGETLIPVGPPVPDLEPIEFVTVTVDFEVDDHGHGGSYLVVHLPDGTVLSIPIDIFKPEPSNPRAHPSDDLVRVLALSAMARRLAPLVHGQEAHAVVERAARELHTHVTDVELQRVLRSAVLRHGTPEDLARIMAARDSHR